VTSGSYLTVPNIASCGSSPVCMATSTHITNGSSTTDHLFGTSGAFTEGEIIASPSTQTSALDIDQNYFTELEYVLTATVNADDVLCFRVTNAGDPLDYYNNVPELGLQFNPVFGAIVLNGGQDIILSPGATTTVYATGTVTDYNGYNDIVSATSTIYRSGAGPLCAINDNNCYRGDNFTGQCSFVNCSGNTCEVQCRADIYFHADPTDFGAYEGEEWFAYLEASDAGGGYDFASASGVELVTLRALLVDDSINYGALYVGQNTGAMNAQTDVVNTGNVTFDISIDSTNLFDGLSSVIPAEQQKFATTTFTYGACALCSQASSSESVVAGLILSKPTAINPPVSAPIYWGIEIPVNSNSAPHSGVNVFTPISPQ